jgi:glycosyltransferase involved in cell wall biosynthesis
MAPFLTVCIMTCNRVGTLRETLDSVLPQIADLPEVEVFVSDNASADNTQEVVSDYCARHPRLRYSRNATNVGFVGNVVASIEKAAGEYIYFLSDDDLAPAGLVSSLVKDLSESRPVAAYINHTPFYHDNPAQAGAPTQPVVKRLFTNPREYFLYCGLGFISALVLKTAEARKHTGKVSAGRDAAHVEIAARVVLTTTGPYLFDGALTVLARHAQTSLYDVLRLGAMNTTQVHLDLFQEGLLTQADVDWHNRKTIRLFLPRLIFNNRLRARGIVTAGELRNLYGKDPLFYVYAYPLLLIPPPLLRWIALPLRALMRKRRDWMLKRGKAAPPPHIAPS